MMLLWLATLMTLIPIVPLRVLVTPLDGPAISGAWQSPVATGQITLEIDGQSRSWLMTDLLEVAFPDHPVAETDTVAYPLRIEMHNGSFFQARIIEANESQLVLNCPFSPQAAWPLRELQSIAWSRSELPAPDFSTAPSSTSDTLWMIRDKSTVPVSGTLLALGPTSGRFQLPNRTVEFQYDKTAALLLAGGDSQPHSTTHLVLTDRSRLAGQIRRLDAQNIEVEISPDQFITLPLTQVTALQLNNDRVVYLSDLPAPREQNDHFLDISWPMRLNRSVSNQSLRMNGVGFERGIGVRATSRLEYTLTESYAQLQATIGVDDAVRPHGSVVFRVMGDNQELFNSGLLTGRDPPLAISVSLAGISRLTLLVEPGDDLDIADHADWANIRLIKSD
ncbi:MAG: hypothetical protein HJJLKODD_01032 [Phycisphaerae bacterium]|nr:hypothetical protein [Phycisphaerae bacterium]